MRESRIRIHTAFWLGVFVTSLIAAPVAVGIWKATEAATQNIIYFLFGVLTSLLVSLVILLFLRERVFSGILNRREASIQSITKGIADTLSAATRNDPEGIAANSAELAGRVVHWWAWTNLYRWIIATALAIVVSLAGFAGTVLLFEQNKKLSQQTDQLELQSKQVEAQVRQAAEQNALMSINLVPELRARLSSNAILNEYQRDHSETNFDNKCKLSYDDFEISAGPNMATMQSVKLLMESELIGDAVTSALGLLIHDKDSSVALGALILLDEAGLLESILSNGGGFIHLSNIFVDNISILSDARLIFTDSYIMRLDCPKCLVGVRKSIFFQSRVGDLYETYSSLLSRLSLGMTASEDPVDIDETSPMGLPSLGSSYITEGQFEGDADRLVVPVPLDKYDYMDMNLYVEEDSGGDPCSVLNNIAIDNQFLKFEALSP